ncbi:YqeB family protein [Saccharothrix sp. Mg75]|uniref:YqeB family protein n=1 Tax=Saccharothrix sp. Mg75 TaxID=3445357 RepID=UPI003EEA6B21
MDVRRITAVTEPGWQVALVSVGFPLLGAGVLFGLKSIAAWVVELPVAPAKGLFQLVAQVPEPWGTVGSLGVGLLLGLVVAAIAAHERLTVEVFNEGVELKRGGKTWNVDRTLVSGVFLDGKKLVLLGVDTGELARESHDLEAAALADAFQTHGYQWLDGDPYAGDYRRWVAGTPDMPPGGDALLKVRAEALRKGDKEDAAQLREELGKLGVVVREERKRQFWRLTRART